MMNVRVCGGAALFGCLLAFGACGSDRGEVDTASRLLADELVGLTYTSTVALDEEQYARLWQTVGLRGRRPAVDFASSIVIHFGAVYGSSCPELRFGGVVVDAEDRLVYADIDHLDDGVCTSDANPRAFVVEVGRERLPPSPFWVQVSADAVCTGCGGSEMTLVDLDAGITDDWLEVLRPPAERPRDNPFPPVAVEDTELLDDLLRLFRIYGDTIDPGFAAVDAARLVDVSVFMESVAAAQTAFAATQLEFDDVVARLSGDQRGLVVDVADAAAVVRDAERDWLRGLAAVEPALRLRIDDPGKAVHEWDRAATNANQARDEADARMNDFLYAVEMVIDDE